MCSPQSAQQKAISNFAGWQTAIAPQQLAFAFVVALAVSMFFGFYPARRASRLDPTAALRYEQPTPSGVDGLFTQMTQAHSVVGRGLRLPSARAGTGPGRWAICLGASDGFGTRVLA